MLRVLSRIGNKVTRIIAPHVFARDAVSKPEPAVVFHALPEEATKLIQASTYSESAVADGNGVVAGFLADDENLAGPWYDIVDNLTLVVTCAVGHGSAGAAD